jgi:hypothetical protein
MKVVFYSDKCEYSKKLLAYLDKHNIRSNFRLICIDNNEVPKEIDIVPTIVDSQLTLPLKGKKAFEYLLNLRYFNNPTNNIELVKDITNPDIKEDELANNTMDKKGFLNLAPEQNSNINISQQFHEEHKNVEASKSTQNMIDMRKGQDKMFLLLSKMKR